MQSRFVTCAPAIDLQRQNGSPFTEGEAGLLKTRTLRSGNLPPRMLRRASSPLEAGARGGLLKTCRLRNRPALTSRFRHDPTTKETPRSDALRRNGICAAPRRTWRKSTEVVSDPFLMSGDFPPRIVRGAPPL